MEHTVFFARVPGYDQPAVDEAVERIFAHCPAAARLQGGMKVTLKPNLLAKHAPDRAVTTHPAVVRAVIRAVKRRGVAEITVADSPGGLYNPGVMRSLYEVSGLAAVCREEGAECYAGCGYGEKETDGELVRRFNLIDPVREADFLIDLPKMKTHVMTGMTGAVKNLFGTIPGLQKAELHMRFSQKEDFGRMLADLCGLVAPDMAVMDAVTAMEGDGPAGGSPREVGLLLGGEDVWSMDLAVCGLMGLDARKVPYLQAGMKRGVCAESFDPALCRGDADAYAPVPGWKLPESYVAFNFAGRFPSGLKWAAPLVAEWAAPRPRVRQAKCIGCGKCAEICPQKTIDLGGGKAKIDPRGCIRCFCCHEMCPVKAIDVKRPLGTIFDM